MTMTMHRDTPNFVDQRPSVGNDDRNRYGNHQCNDNNNNNTNTGNNDKYLDHQHNAMKCLPKPNRVRRDTSESSYQFLSHAYVDGDETDDDCCGRNTTNTTNATSPPRSLQNLHSSTSKSNSRSNKNHNNTDNRNTQDDLLRKSLGPNASLTYSALSSLGPPTRPLEFPAPTVDRAMTIATNVIDHRTGNIFRASSVLMKRPVHVKTCGARTVLSLMEGGGGGGSGGMMSSSSQHGYKKKSSNGSGVIGPNSEHGMGHTRSNSGNTHYSMSSWHSPITSMGLSSGTDGSFASDSTTGNSSNPQQQNQSQQQQQQQQQQTATQQQLLQQQIQNLKPCGLECDLPERAYCVRRKLCDTTYGSVRLCVVLKRRSRNVLGGGVKNMVGDAGMMGGGVVGGSSSTNGWDSMARRAQDLFGLIGEPAWETTEEMVAVKVVNWSKLQTLRGRHLEDPIKELAAMQLLGNYHPNVISISDSLQDETHLFCVFPYCPGGDLYERVLEEMKLSPTGKVNEHQARKWFRQLLGALSQFQKKGICHRDLCMENILVDECDNIQVIDFGLCLRVPYTDPTNRNLVTDVSANTARRLMKAQGQGGLMQYMAPEVLQRDTFDGFAIDLWAAGIVLFELLIGKKPFSMPDKVDANFECISMRGDLEGLLRMKGVEMDREAMNLLQSMLQCDPKKRLTLAEVVDHPWVQRGYGGDKKKRIYSTEDSLSIRWFVHSNPIDDDGPNCNIDPSRLRIFSCSSVDSMLDKNVNDYEDDATADESKSSSSISPPNVPHHSDPYLDSEQSVSDASDKTNNDNGPRKHESRLDAEMLDKLDELYSKKKKTSLTACLNPKKWWPKSSKSTPMATINEHRTRPNNANAVNVVHHGDGSIC